MVVATYISSATKASSSHKPSLYNSFRQEQPGGLTFQPRGTALSKRNDRSRRDRCWELKPDRRSWCSVNIDLGLRATVRIYRQKARRFAAGESSMTSFESSCLRRHPLSNLVPGRQCPRN